MSNIKKVFQKGPAFIAYLTAGQKGLNYSLDAALSLIEGGVNVLEIGVPFSDPVADGPVIQQAMIDAINKNTSIFDVLKLIKDIKKKANITIVLFTYFNPLLQALEKNFFQQAKDAGVNGILIVDLPLEESADYLSKCDAHNIDPIFVISPSTNSDRVKKINKKAKGFLYYACRKGITGVKNSLPDDFKDQINLIKQNSHLPIAVGFGISSRAMAKEVINHADGFVVGSLFVDAIEKGASPVELKKLAIKIDPRMEEL